MITIINKTKRLKVFLVPHVMICKAIGKCRCGNPSSCTKPRNIASLTIPSGASISGLPGELATLPEIVHAVKRGDIEISYEPIKPPKKVEPKPVKKRRKKKSENSAK